MVAVGSSYQSALHVQGPEPNTTVCTLLQVASSDLVNMGISVVSYTLKDVRDSEVWILKLQRTVRITAVLFLCT